jgi:hypothetical protein
VCKCILKLIFNKKEENGGIKGVCCRVAWEVANETPMVAALEAEHQFLNKD